MAVRRNQLSQINISGYKSIKKCNLALNKINVLIGSNGAGKSNFISALSLLQSVLNHTMQLTVGQSGINSLFYNGRKITDEISIEVYFNNNFYGFNLIPTDDIIGLQFLGTVKNVLAILFGISEGAKYSISTKSYLITKILNELKQIIINIGGNQDTILNLCGIGDIWLTCNSDQSRNFTLGKMIGENKDKIEIDNYLKETTVEGLMNLNILIELLDKYKQDTKTFKLIHDLIYKKEDVDKLLKI